MKIVVSGYVSPNYYTSLIFSSLSCNFHRCAVCFQSFSKNRLQEYGSKCRAYQLKMIAIFWVYIWGYQLDARFGSLLGCMQIIFSKIT